MTTKPTKRPKRVSPTQRALACCRKQGWPAAIVERWNPHARVHQDLWGFADLIVCEPGRRPLLVQVTSGANHSARQTKIDELVQDPEKEASKLDAFFSVEVWSFSKRGARGERKLWTLRRSVRLPLTGEWLEVGEET